MSIVANTTATGQDFKISRVESTETWARKIHFISTFANSNEFYIKRDLAKNAFSLNHEAGQTVYYTRVVIVGIRAAPAFAFYLFYTATKDALHCVYYGLSSF